MFLLLLTTASCCLLTYIYLRWLRVKSYWAQRNVSHLPPHPIMGGLTFLQKENPSIWFRKIYNTFRTPYVGTWLFWRPALIINSPDIAKNILVKDHQNFRNRFLGSGKTDPIGSLNLFTVNDPLWSFMRSRLTILFTAAKLRSLHGFITTKTVELSKRIKNDSYNKKFVDIRSTCADFTTDIIVCAAFGIDNNATLTGEGVIEKVTKDFMSYDWHRGMSWSSIFFFPELADIFKFSFFPKDATDLIRKVYQSLLNRRGGYEYKPSEIKDLIDALMKIKLEAESQNIDITDDVLVAQISIFLFGGFDTTAVSLTYITYELAYHPEVQERLYQTLLEAKRNIGDDKELDGSTLAEIPYLTAVIKETMRIFPSMGWLDRIAAKDYQIDATLTIPAGTPVYVNAAGMHLDPDLYPDPLKYDPDRRDICMEWPGCKTMRIFPSMGWLDRIAAKDYQIDATLTIPAGTPVYVNAAGMHLDPDLYPDPLKYDPDRFMPENEQNLKPLAWLPFGGGPRGCIGRRFALNIIRYVVSSLVLNFKLCPLPDFPRPEDTHIENRGLFLAPDHPLSVNFVPRF